MDINTKKLKKNAFRVSKVRGLTASRVRVPGGCCNADVMQQVVDIARKYGNGQIHLTTRQGFEIEGIHMEDMDKVNEMLQPIIDNLQMRQVPGIRHQEPEMSVHVSETESVLLEIIIQQPLRRELKRLYFLMTFILKLHLQDVPMTVSRRECMILGLLA